MRANPASIVIKPASTFRRWAIYFAYSPKGDAWGQHKFSIKQLQANGFRVLLVLACIEPSSTQLQDWQCADAIIWKDLPGFDFSGLKVGLEHLANTNPGCDVLWMNDSVFGPLTPLGPIVERCKWRITGFTESRAVEPHLQSYAFYFRGVDDKLIETTRAVIPSTFAIGTHSAVAYLQEMRLARILCRRHDVGVLWKPIENTTDLTMAHPFELIESGYPFMKRSIAGKFRREFDENIAFRILTQHQHPSKECATLFEGYTPNTTNQ
jgi:lipopolysaccharide biosynthesis protein